MRPMNIQGLYGQQPGPSAFGGFPGLAPPAALPGFPSFGGPPPPANFGGQQPNFGGPPAGLSAAPSPGLAGGQGRSMQVPQMTAAPPTVRQQSAQPPVVSQQAPNVRTSQGGTVTAPVAGGVQQASYAGQVPSGTSSSFVQPPGPSYSSQSPTARVSAQLPPTLPAGASGINSPRVRSSVGPTGLPQPTTPMAATPMSATSPTTIIRSSQQIASQPVNAARRSKNPIATAPIIGTLRFDDWNRQQLVSSRPKGEASEGSKPADVAGGHKALEYALQVILNVQSLDSQVLARAMLTPADSSLDAAALLNRLQEFGPALVRAEDNLRNSVRLLNQDAAVALLKDLGMDQEAVVAMLSRSSLPQLQEEIVQVLKEALPAESISDAVSTIAQRRLRNHLERRGVDRYSDDIISLRHDDESWGKVWDRIYVSYPSRPPAAPLAEGLKHRSSIRVIVIGPGFGLLATPQMIDLVRGAGYQLLELPTLPNLEQVKDPNVVQEAVRKLHEQVASFQPDVIVAASKGALYFPYLWQNPEWSISCLMINAHPSIKQLPAKAAVVITQGSRDGTFKRLVERQRLTLENEEARSMLVKATMFNSLRKPGDSPALVLKKDVEIPVHAADGKVEMKAIPKGAVIKPMATILGRTPGDTSGTGSTRLGSMDDLATLTVPAVISYRYGREDLEDLVRTGAPKQVFLYLSNSGISERPGKPPAFTRLGDGHAAPASLLKEDTLPRLIDAAATGKPEDTLHHTFPTLLAEERRKGETFLGHDPQSIKRFWTGVERPGGLGRRFKVEPSSAEFNAIRQIFMANPTEKVYNFKRDWSVKKIVNIDRVQAPEQYEAADAFFVSVQKGLERQGTTFVNGVHTRWLFHGSNAIDSIVSDPLNGFKVTLSKTSMWGLGIYMARDAQYPDDHGFFGEPREDGTKDMLLCLCTTGVSVLGDEAYAITPYRPHSRHRYNSFVDSMSNPEIFVVNTPAAIVPAYVITYL